MACLLCGLGAAVFLGDLWQWPKVAALSLVIGGTQCALAATGLLPLSAFGAGLAGLVVYLACARLKRSAFREAGAPASGRLTPPEVRPPRIEEAASPSLTPNPAQTRRSEDTAWRTIADYAALTLLMGAVTMIGPVRTWAQGKVWKASFPEVTSRRQFSTPPGTGQVFRPLAHPGTLMLIVVAGSIAWSGCRKGEGLERAARAARATWRSAGAASIGVLSMVGLSTLTDHCGMSYLLAEGLSRVLGGSYPVVSPWVGILGAFATGSNNNSNVLFGSLQKNVALLIRINPNLLVAAQTAGGSLGSMLAPVKIILGCSTVGTVGQEGSVLRKTVPLGLALGLILGLLTWALAHFCAPRS